MKVLPREKRESLTAVYGYARLVDEVGDNPLAEPGRRLEDLEAVEAELHNAFAGSASHPLFTALTPVIERYSLAKAPFLDLIEANRMDQRVTSYETFDELLSYCALSANPVGRLVLAVFGAAGDEERDRLSDLVCSGLQLVEHFQDVREDALNGRVYLPREDLERFGVPAATFLAERAGEDLVMAFRRMMAFEVSRAREMLRHGPLLVSRLSPWPGLAVAAYAGGGLAQLEAIESLRYDVLANKSKASHTAVGAATLSVLAEAATEKLRRRGLPDAR
jgi:squalene synthase HpnC